MLVLRRAIAGLIDLGLVLATAAGYFHIMRFFMHEDYPPRYWNYWDYFVDLVNYHPSIVLEFVEAYILVGVVYFFLLGMLGRTVGMLAVNLRFKGGYRRGKVGGVLLAGRFVLFSILMFVAGLPVASVLWTQGSTGIHDLPFGVRMELAKEVR